MSVIIGINAFHGDSSACIVVNGQLLAAVEEERLRRVKHWAGFPSLSIKECLKVANMKISDVDVIAVNSNPKANLSSKVSFAFKNKQGLKFAADRFFSRRSHRSIVKRLDDEFKNEKFNGVVRKVEHHDAHLASAYYVSNYENSLVVSIDGLGDFASTAWGIGNGDKIKTLGKILFPHSLGVFYEAMTHYLGFKNYGDEYKVMGLAPYGAGRYINECRHLINLLDNGEFRLNLDYFSHHLGQGQHSWENGVPVSGDCFSDAMCDLFGPARDSGSEITQVHKDIAYCVQKTYEDAFFHLLNTVHNQHPLDNLSLAGGCGMNSVANGKIYRNTPFKSIYIQSAAGDAGGAIGAAYAVWHEQGGHRSFFMNHSYWGPSFSNDDYKKLLDSNSADLENKQCEFFHITDENVLCERTAHALSEGKVVGWFQGRMEWGPRALGNRSILGDPRRSDMKDILNLKIKRRESFRPFAPSILRNAVSEWFEQDDDVPFMMQVYPIKKEKQHQIPAVTHVDGSGRLQTVTEETNPRYYRLISVFGEVTGVPILLNTSFNENEPVVCRPEEALDCFLRTRMDVLVLGDWFVMRKADK